MRRRSCFSLLLVLSAAACAVATDSPTAPPSLAASSVDDGEPPPPPLDTGDVNVDVDAGGTFFRTAGRYFANTQGTNAWIAFVSNGDVIASPNARLQYHEQSRRTSGKGTLRVIATGATLDLSRVQITSGRFGSCPTAGSPSSDGFLVCGGAEFTVGNDGTRGRISVSRRTAIPSGS